MIHPDLRVLYTVPERIRKSELEMCRAIFAAIAPLHLAAEMVGEQLVAIADAQNRYAARKNVGVDVGTAWLVNTGRTA